MRGIRRFTRGMYNINEIFRTLQGEGFYTGRPAVFVRFAGCNLRCSFCDTDFRLRERMSAEELLDAVEALAPEKDRFVVLTGGEPSLQVDEILVELLHQAGFEIAIETNGTHGLPKGIDWITCSPKDGSEVVVERVDELKVVYLGHEVEKWYREIPATHYFLQPCATTKADGSYAFNTEETQQYILRHTHWRLSLQTHKILGFK